jgi:hypothetical protein
MKGNYLLSDNHSVRVIANSFFFLLITSPETPVTRSLQLRNSLQQPTSLLICCESTYSVVGHFVHDPGDVSGNVDFLLLGSDYERVLEQLLVLWSGKFFFY